MLVFCRIQVVGEISCCIVPSIVYRSVAIEFRSHTYVCARGPFVAFGVEFLVNLGVFVKIEIGCGISEDARSCDMIERAEPAFGLQV